MPPEDNPPTSSGKKPTKKKRTRRQKNRPDCGMCGEQMTAQHSEPHATFYQCTNEDCPNTTGQWINRPEAIEQMERNRVMGAMTPDVRARADMKEIEEPDPGKK